MTTSATWIGTDPTARIAASVPPEVIHAIEAYERARECRGIWNSIYIRDREQDALDKCNQYGRLMDQHWRHLEALLPVEAGFYPHAGRVYGYAKRDGCGLKLVRESGWSRWPDPARAERARLALSRRREDEARFEAYAGSIRR